jgi:hypothetical protein
MGLTVGVTFFVHDKPRAIWINGGFQHCVFLVRALENCPSVDRVIAVNGGDGERPDPAMCVDDWEFVRFDEVADELDVYIECGAQIPKEHEQRVHANGGVVIGYRFGNSFVLDGEKLVRGSALQQIIHQLDAEKGLFSDAAQELRKRLQRLGGDQGIFNGTQFDAIWSNAQHMDTNASYWEACYRCPVACMPHVWDPTFIDRAISELPEDIEFRYRPGTRPKSIAIFEPNFNIVKLCHIPILTCELVYRDHPELIDKVWATNTDKLRSQLTFKRFHAALDIGHEKAADGHNVLTCETRWILPFFMARHADIVVTHQWENALNYVYYEALYGRYPLVHNSHLLPEGVGYRYHGFDAHDGAKALLEVLRWHDWRRNEYEEKAISFLEAHVYSSAPANIAAYDEELKKLIASRAA